MRTCPDCAEEVQDAARVCRYCGFQFADAHGGGQPAGQLPPSAAETSSATAKPSPVDRIRSGAEEFVDSIRFAPGAVKLAGVVLVFLLVLTAYSLTRSPDPAPDSLAGSQPPPVSPAPAPEVDEETDAEVAAAERRERQAERERKVEHRVVAAFGEVEAYCDDYSDAQFKIDYGKYDKSQEGYREVHDLLTNQGFDRLQDPMSDLLTVYSFVPTARIKSAGMRDVVLDAIDIVNTRCGMPDIAGNYLDQLDRADRGF